MGEEMQIRYIHAWALPLGGKEYMAVSGVSTVFEVVHEK